MTLKTTIVIAGVLITTAIVHGRLTDRWGVPAAVSRAAARLNEVPTEIAGWQSTSNPVSRRTLIASGAENILDREYKNADGDQIRVMVVCGRPGPVSRHPPTVCFTSAGLKQVSELRTIEKTRPDSKPAKFAQCLFLADGAASKINTEWSFSGDGREWQKPADPRFAFATHGWLYKLYVISIDTNNARTTADRDAFTQQLLTELSATLL